MSQTHDDNRTAQRAWNANADFRDERMASGNDFFNTLVWPVVDKLLAPSPASGCCPSRTRGRRVRRRALQYGADGSGRHRSADECSCAPAETRGTLRVLGGTSMFQQPGSRSDERVRRPGRDTRHHALGQDFTIPHTFTQPGLAMYDQPEPHPYFHRPLTALLGFTEIPPALIARVVRPAA